MQQTRGAGCDNGLQRSALCSGPRHDAGSCKAPTAVNEHSDAKSVRLTIADSGYPAFARLDRLPPIPSHARISIRSAS